MEEQPSILDGLSPYRAMWLIAMFDLPVTDKAARRAYMHFRTSLLKAGFMMLQYSVYGRFCLNEEASKIHRRMLEIQVPDQGEVRVLTITDKQFEKMEVFFGGEPKAPEEALGQKLLF